MRDAAVLVGDLIQRFAGMAHLRGAFFGFWTGMADVADGSPWRRARSTREEIR